MNRGAIVLLSGRVKGTDREAACEVLARRLFRSYTDCSVITAPADLPDGEYTVYVEEHSFAATKHDGRWLSRGASAGLNGQKSPSADKR